MRFSSRLYRPLYIWLSHSCSSSSHTAYLSSRFFVTSTKNFRSRLPSNSYWKLKNCGWEKNISTSLCRTRPVYSNQIDSEKKLQLGILYNQQRKKREKDVLSPTSFGTASELASNGIHLDALTRRLKEEREHFDGSGYEKSSLGKNFEERKETEVDKVRATGETGGDLVNVKSATIKAEVTETHIDPISVCQTDLIKRLSSIYGEVRVVDNISAAKEVVRVLTDRYRHLVHACDTEVCEIDVKQETPVDHGEIICFSIYSGLDADFGNGKSCIWVDVLDGGGRDLLVEFAPFFEDPSIKKVWHNYSFDNHVIENYGIKVSGFHADTMHMARLWDSSRSTKGGYSLEALTSDQKVMSKENLIGKMSKKTVSSRRKVKKDGSEYKIIATPMVNKENLIGKVSKKDGSEGKVIAAPLVNKENLVGKVAMKTIFGRKKLKKDGTEGKIITIPPVEELQRKERTPWICYSVLDSISTLQLYESLKSKLEMMSWNLEGVQTGTMFNFYETYWRPFGEILVKMETEGILVDRAYLAEIEEVAIAEQQVAANRFRNWASTYCADAQYMNLGSGAQLRQLFFGGTKNREVIHQGGMVEFIAH